MPSVDEHLTQFSSNKNVLNEPCFNFESSKYREWCITIIFYAAVHLIEMELAKSNQHTTSHEIRKKAMISIRIFDPIFNDYYVLFMKSVKARYECVKFKPKKVHEAFATLTKIEKYLNVS